MVRGKTHQEYATSLSHPYTTFEINSNDGRLDRSYEYDQVGRLAFAHTGAEARAHAYSGQWGTMDGPYSLGFDYDAWGNMTHRYGWGGEVQGGGAGQSSDLYYSYASTNRRTGFTYDAAEISPTISGKHSRTMRRASKSMRPTVDIHWTRLTMAMACASRKRRPAQALLITCV